MEKNIFAMMEVVSKYSAETREWEEEDREYKGEVLLPLESPVASQDFAALLENVDVHLEIVTYLNDYGRRIIEARTGDGQLLYTFLGRAAEDK